MTRRLGFAVTALILVVSAGCTGGSPAPRPSATPAFAKGGTLRVGMVHPWDYSPRARPDPQNDYAAVPWEIYRCCLVRMLLSFNGHPLDQGGAVLRPDLAVAMPDVSSNLLTWTFHLKHGLHYAPPLQTQEITSYDFERALKREARKTPHGYAFYYEVIEGFRAYETGRSDTISGLTTPDRYTLRIRLNQPAGDLGYRLAMPAITPFPANPARPTDPFGVATGHDRTYTRFLVGTGPYMIEGADALDFSKRPTSQQPVSGYVPPRIDRAGRITRPGSLTLVRNPSWRRGDDNLRSAYANRIQVRIGGSVAGDARMVDTGRLDVVLDQPAPVKQMRRYRGDPALSGRAFTTTSDFIWYLTMNLAQPPFDDIHVRKAMNLIVDKQRVADQTAAVGFAGVSVGRAATHIGWDDTENNQLLTFDPYETPGHHGSVAKARAQMRQSKYDRDHDGRCDASVCRRVLAVAAVGGDVSNIPRDAARLIAREAKEIGIHLKLSMETTGSGFYGPIVHPRRKVALGIGAGWGKDFQSASDLFPALFRRHDIGSTNYSLLGATSTQLKRWGYPVRQVPTVDSRIDQCMASIGEAQIQCWAGLDKHLMDDVVPWVPYLVPVLGTTVSGRVAHFNFDQFINLPALDQIALKPSAIRKS